MQFLKCISILAASTAVTCNGVAATQKTEGKLPPAEVAHARKLLADWIHSGENSTNHHDAAYWQRSLKAIASQVKPQVFVYLEKHDPDSQFREDVIANFGEELPPAYMFPTYAYLARNDSAWRIRSQSLAEVDIAYERGKLRGQSKEVEQLAIDRVNDPRPRYFALRILAFTHDARADKILRGVVAGNYDSIDKRIATKGLRGELKIGSGN